MIRARREGRLDSRLPLLLLLICRLVLGISYSLIVPVWEAYDEDGHFAYVRYLAIYHRLLDPADPNAQAVFERFQPPLYYILVAPFVAALDLGPTPPQPERNPFWAYANAGHNYALHPPRLEGAAAEIELAVHVARLVGVVISTLSVVFVYGLARRVWAGQDRPQLGPVWAATLLYAFWPQFLFVGSMITNDLAVTAFSAGVLAMSVELVSEGFEARRALALAAFLAAAVLSKLNGLALLPVAVLAIALSLTPVLRQARRRSTRTWLVIAALVCVVGGALAGLSLLPFVTGQVLRLEVLMRFLFNLFRTQNSLGIVFGAMLYAFHTFPASFGWGGVEGPAWLYPLWSAGFVLGTLGLVLGAVQRWRGQPGGPNARMLLMPALLVFSLLAATLALAVAVQTTDLAPGRYLLPSLPAVCLLLVAGYRELLTQRAQRYAWRALGLGAVLVGWAIPLVTLIPTYAIPQPLQGAVDVPARYTFGDAIQLIGYQTPAVVQPGQVARIVVCWQATAPVPENDIVFLEAIGPYGRSYGQLETYPGRGNFPTRFWTPGIRFCDPYDLPVELAMPAPAQAWVRVTLLRTADVNGPRLPVTDDQGLRLASDAYALPVKVVAPSRPAAPDQLLDYRFGNELWLRGYSLAVEPATRSVRVTFQWQALRDLDRDYGIFVHLRDSPVHAYTQGDGQPRSGWYPTHLWQEGEVIEDAHVLTLPPGTSPPLALYVGVVSQPLNMRLAAFDPAHRRLVHDEIILFNNWIIDNRWLKPVSLKPPYEAP